MYYNVKYIPHQIEVRLIHRVGNSSWADRFIFVAGELCAVSELLDPDAVFWDIGGVIVELESIQSGHRDFIDSLLETYQSPLPPAEALSTWRSELSTYFGETEGTNYRPAREGYRRAVDAILSGEEAAADWEPMFEEIHDEHANPHPGAIETIQQLAETNLHLGVISDVDHNEGQRLLETFGIRDAFDSFTSSEEVGRRKPDPEIFDTALRKAGVSGEDAMMIGDRYTHDMEGGREAGMTTIAYGADDGPAVDYQVDNLREVPLLLGIEAEQPR